MHSPPLHFRDAILQTARALAILGMFISVGLRQVGAHVSKIHCFSCRRKACRREEAQIDGTADAVHPQMSGQRSVDARLHSLQDIDNILQTMQVSRWRRPTTPFLAICFRRLKLYCLHRYHLLSPRYCMSAMTVHRRLSCPAAG